MKRIALIAAACLLLGASGPSEELLNDGIQAARRGDLVRAEQLIARAIRIDPHESDGYPVHFWHGVVLSALGKDDAALKEWKEAERQQSKVLDLRRRIDATGATSPQERAENARKDAMLLDARSTKSFRAGEAAMRAGKFDEARASYRKALGESREMMVMAHPGKPPRPLPVPIPLPQPVPVDTMATTTMAMSTETGVTATTATTATTTTGHKTSTDTTGDEDAGDEDGDAVEPPNVFDEIKRRFQALSPGTVAFNAPDQMKVGETRTVIVRIAPKGEGEGITSNLSGPTTTGHQEHITPTMAARLNGDGFGITPLTPETQLVAGGGFAEWRWSVNATESGDHDLNLSIIAKLDQLERVVGTQTHKVHIAADPGAAVEGFLAKNWQWLASTIMIPLIVLLYRSRSKGAKE